MVVSRKYIGLSLPIQVRTTIMKLFFVFLFLLLKWSPAVGEKTAPFCSCDAPPNMRLSQAYTAFQAWKDVMTCDPQNITSDWVGANVCDYTGVYCAPAPDDPNVLTVAGIDLNYAGICGILPEKLSLLSDLALIHLNSNRFTGKLPSSLNGKYLYEFDASNNEFSGEFPVDVLSLPSLRYFDIRFNKFTGKIPASLFDRNLDAIFINDNRFTGLIPANLGKSSASVVVIADLKLSGCIPTSIGDMSSNLDEIVLLNNGLTGCIPPEVGSLDSVTVFDVGRNKLSGPLPAKIIGMSSLEVLNVASNQLSGVIPDGLCRLPNLKNFTFQDNFFTVEPPSCVALPAKNATGNCILGSPLQKITALCSSFQSKPVRCEQRGSCVVPVPMPFKPPMEQIKPPPCSGSGWGSGSGWDGGSGRGGSFCIGQGSGSGQGSGGGVGFGIGIGIGIGGGGG